MYAQVAWVLSCANYMQHNVCLAHGTRDCIALDRLQIAFIWASVYWWNHLPMKERRKPEYLEKTPDDEVQKMPPTKARKFKPQTRLEPPIQHWWHARKVDKLTTTSRTTPTTYLLWCKPSPTHTYLYGNCIIQQSQMWHTSNCSIQTFWHTHTHMVTVSYKNHKFNIFQSYHMVQKDSNCWFGQGWNGNIFQVQLLTESANQRWLKLQFLRLRDSDWRND